MPDIGWMELLLIGIVALIVVGPKDLPIMFRRAGQFTGRIRAMARDFQRAMDEAADETGMSDLNRDIRSATSYARNPVKAGKDALKDAVGDLDPTKFPEGSHTRAEAEKRKAASEAAREKARATAEARKSTPAAPADAAEPAKPMADAEAGAPEAEEPVVPASTGTDRA